MLRHSDHECAKYEIVKNSINIFTVSVGLVASGYEMSPDKEMAEKIRAIEWNRDVIAYFIKARTAYCEVNPYWPRGANLLFVSMDLKEPPEIGFTDFQKVKSYLQNYSSADSRENDEDMFTWLFKLPEFYRLIQENENFDTLWADYLKSIEGLILSLRKLLMKQEKRLLPNS